MTDNEIMKALEAEIRFCELFNRSSTDVKLDVLKNTLDLINRQNAEIERLKHYCFGFAILRNNRKLR